MISLIRRLLQLLLRCGETQFHNSVCRAAEAPICGQQRKDKVLAHGQRHQIEWAVPALGWLALQQL